MQFSLFFLCIIQVPSTYLNNTNNAAAVLQVCELDINPSREEFSESCASSVTRQVHNINQRKGFFYVYLPISYGAHLWAPSSSCAELFAKASTMSMFQINSLDARIELRDTLRFAMRPCEAKPYTWGSVHQEATHRKHIDCSHTVDHITWWARGNVDRLLLKRNIALKPRKPLVIQKYNVLLF